MEPDPLPPAPQLTRHQAPIYVENSSNRHFQIQVLHSLHGEFSGGHNIPNEDSGFILIPPGTQKYLMQVTYLTGFLYLGVDNWQVHGIELNGSGDPIRTWKCGHGVGAKWKVHSLRSEDDGKKTVVKILEDTVEFISPSGTSSTSWN